jgi:peroxiredoxin
MIPILRLATLFFLLAATMAGPPKVGEPAREFALPSSTGSTLSLMDYAGKSNVVLVFYRGYW